MPNKKYLFRRNSLLFFLLLFFILWTSALYPSRDIETASVRLSDETKGDALFFVAMDQLRCGEQTNAENFFIKASNLASPEFRREARYRLGLLYFDQAQKASAAGGNGEQVHILLHKLVSLSAGEKIDPDLRLRTMINETRASLGLWMEILASAEQELPLDADPASSQRLALTLALARYETERETSSLLQAFVSNDGELTGEGLASIINGGGSLHLSRDREIHAIADLLLALNGGSRKEVLSTFLIAIRDAGAEIAGTPLYLSAVRNCGYGSDAGLLFDHTLELLPFVEPFPERKAALLEAAGFLARRAGQYDDALPLFDEAVDSAAEAASFDSLHMQRIVWYRFDSLVHADPHRAASAIPQLLGNMVDPRYFDDTLGALLDELLRQSEWPLIDTIARSLGRDLPAASASRYYYLAARGRQLALLPEDGMQETLFRRILDLPPSGTTARYYRILAASALERFSGEEEADYAFFYPAAEGRDEATQEESSFPCCMRVIRGLLDHGFSLEAEKELSRLESCGFLPPRSLIIDTVKGLSHEGHHLEAIRRFDRFANERGISGNEELRILYPRPFRAYVHEVTEREGLEENLFYALVREESHFTPDIYSRVGAVGLSQLMPSTARDVAGRMGLKIPSNEDLHDPRLNLSIGAWYLAHLAGRTDNISEALFAYNGGLTRVRRWRSSNSDLPDDLFAETIPFAETQYYGRKLLVSTSIYRYLYRADSPEGPLWPVDTFFPKR
ncbi:Lytic transglycosylase catalytic [Sediminispirochaeta smaragdinae DSM 11293]|uniref:Lytic transglycosylase catalytic n=2 Tax=Sediminispirochaeta TaxID=1911556 RepID=E1R856_SEDSS|nr:Lytic transglycosylase catalytic [Sediminispirochaeta smaragdinae DSM 11293]